MDATRRAAAAQQLQLHREETSLMYIKWVIHKVIESENDE